MNILRLPVFFCAMLLVAVNVLHADFAISAEPETPVVIPDCFTPCAVTYKECFGRVKDSPNDIEREMCENERKECVTKCDVETKELLKEQRAQEARKLEEMEALRQQQKETWDQQGLTQKEQRTMRRQVREERNEQEEPGQHQDATSQEQKETASPEQQSGETLNGTIKVYQFK